LVVVDGSGGSSGGGGGGGGGNGGNSGSGSGDSGIYPLPFPSCPNDCVRRVSLVYIIYIIYIIICSSQAHNTRYTCRAQDSSYSLSCRAIFIFIIILLFFTETQSPQYPPHM